VYRRFQVVKKEVAIHPDMKHSARQRSSSRVVVCWFLTRFSAAQYPQIPRHLDFRHIPGARPRITLEIQEWQQEQ
jgi:hypothetical protein